MQDKAKNGRTNAEFIHNSETVAARRRYAVLDVKTAKSITVCLLESYNLAKAIEFGLPEVDDRYHVWRVPLLARHTGEPVGEAVVDAYTSLIDISRTTSRDMLEARLLYRKTTKSHAYPTSDRPRVSSLRNTIAQGDAELVLQELPAESIDLIFTSPPYYNARPGYSEYVSYSDYLLKLRKVIQQSHRVLSEGRFFVINISPVLIRRPSRSHSSKRIAVPFDVHGIFVNEGFDFMDDIIWEKPEGAGWATGRGRRFAADRHPLQYKPVPITEYILVYRKSTDKLIDWHIRHHPDQGVVEASRISDSYERTNVWRIKPAHSAKHPAIFPVELAERIISYYSFVNDVVLDPFAGIGTTASAAIRLGRRFVLIEREAKYVREIQRQAVQWLGPRSKEILRLNCDYETDMDSLL